MAHARKMNTRKNKVVPCTDANQHARERIARRAANAAREQALRERRMEEIRAQYDARMTTASAQALGQDTTGAVSE